MFIFILLYKYKKEDCCCNNINSSSIDIVFSNSSNKFVELYKWNVK